MIIEVRPIIEKEKLKRRIIELKDRLRLGKTHRVPHLTLLYNFTPKIRPFEIAAIIKFTASKFGRLYYRYSGWEVREGEKGHVFGFKIEPSKELRNFRYELYKNLKAHINEDPRTAKYNAKSEEQFWFHSAIAFHMDNYSARIAEDFVNDKTSVIQNIVKYAFPKGHPLNKYPVRPVVMDSEVVRIPIIRNGRIAYEYDALLNRILNRREALSGHYKKLTLIKYREKERIEVNFPSHKKKATIWLVSDTHFKHRDIIRSCSRPFYDVNEMDKIILSNWNNIVSTLDTVYFLGDLTLEGRDEEKRASQRCVNEWIERLNGKKLFINGNHDPKNFGEKSEIIEYRGIKFLLVHDPKDSDGFDGWIIHGHTHNNDLINVPFINFKKRTVNVSVELIKYKPIELDKIVDIIRSYKSEENLLYYEGN